MPILRAVPVLVWTLARTLALAFAATLAACTSPPLIAMPPDDLTAHAARLDVAGHGGWQFNRSLHFGEYGTSVLPGFPSVHTTKTECPNGCTEIRVAPYYRRFDEVFSISTSKLSFTQFGPGGAQAQVQAIDSLDQQQRTWVTEWFAVATQAGSRTLYSASFAGTIQPLRPGLPTWRFVLADGGIGDASGLAEDDGGRRLVMKTLRRWQGDEAPHARDFPVPTLGYTFELDGVVVGAVQVFGDGRVWLRDGLAPDVRLVVAGLSSALMLRVSE